MRIGGLQKLTLLDYPGKVACTVFLSGCNLRCPYCHNPGLVLPEQSEGSEIPEVEVLSFLERRKGKLDGVCITGGEPTLQPELPEFSRKASPSWLCRQAGHQRHQPRHAQGASA